METVARKIVQTLRAAGYTAYFAGGSVRDKLLGREVRDIDIATDATPEEVQQLFPRTVAVGAHFGVIVVVESGIPFEVATFRSDGAYIDGRRPEGVVFTTAEGDAQRRDFSVNGLFYDPVAEEVIDFVDGQADLKAGLLRAIGIPRERFSEDKLRILRGVRLAGALGFEIEQETWAALREMAGQIHVVSVERIRDELIKIFTDSGRVRGFDLLAASGVMREVLPEVADLEGCDQPPEFHPEGDVFVHTRMMLGHLGEQVSIPLAFGVLFHDIGKPACRSVDENGRIRFNGHEHVGARMAEEAMRRLRFSNHDIAAVVDLVRNHMAFKDAPNMRVAKLRRFMARDTFDEEMELHRVDCLSSHGGLDIYAFLKEQRTMRANEPLIPPRLVTGQDLIASGWKPGPIFREALEAIQNLQLEGVLKTKEQALEWLAQNFPSGETS